MNADEIRIALNQRAEEFAAFLFPHGKRDGNHWCVGSINGEPGRSFKICVAGDKVPLWGDFDGSQKSRGSLIDLWMEKRGVDFKTGLRECAEWLGISPQSPSANQKNGQEKKETTKPPIDWLLCVNAFTDKHVQRLAEWRGLSPAFCSELRARGLIGLWQDSIAFPVHREGQVVAVHCRLKDGSWRHAPKGTKTAPLVIGDLSTAVQVHSFESQWDAFDACDKLRLHESAGVAIIVTRGAANGSLISGLVRPDATVYAWKQNDELKNGKRAGDEWLRALTNNTEARVLCVQTPTEFKDLNDWTRRAGATAEDLSAAIRTAAVVSAQEKPAPLIEFKTPSQLKSFVPPPGTVLVGDCHIVKGSVFVIGGAPGIGKSRSAVGLGEAGATADEWFGLKVHRRFKTMIIQSENGLFRLSKEFNDLDCDALEDYVRICPPPPFGLCFSREDFRAQLAIAIAVFQPDVVIFDPWNSVARDDKAGDYLETFKLIRSVLPLGDDTPALGIVAHTRKPRADERATGRGLLNLLAGSYVLGSVPRCIFVMQSASDDPEDSQVVWTCCKNNDGELGHRSAWQRRNGLFAPIADFDWEEFDNPKGDRVTITGDDLAKIFEDGRKPLRRSDAVKALERLTKAKRTACYEALKVDGRFAAGLVESDGLLSWNP